MYNKKKIIFPGSFDPITLGHCDIVNRASNIFSEVIIAIGNNYNKNYMFPIRKRKIWIQNCYRNNNKIKVEVYKNLIISLCKQKKINIILRGLRDVDDFIFEKKFFYINNYLCNQNIETFFLLSSLETSFISSTYVKEIIQKKGPYHKFVPDSVILY